MTKSWREQLKAAAEHLALHDSFLQPVIKQHGLPTFEPHKNYYEALAGSIISQQLSVKAAAAIERRFIALFEDNRFPEPKHILTKSIDELRMAGLSRPKGGYIIDLAEKIVNGTIHFDHLDNLSNEHIVQELTQVKGIGAWTVHMFLMFCMGRLDVLPVGDLGIKNGMKKLYGLNDIPNENDMEQLAETYNWSPYRSVASWYIWKSLDTVPRL
jgi:DNA-3-methyladenine glycosylase II